MTGDERVQRAQARLDAPLEAVRAVLLDPLALPEWNEAFRSIAGPAVASAGAPYRISVRGGLSGRFTYPTIEPDRLVADWQVPGFHEVGTWRFERDGGQTVVGHEFTHAGPLAALLRSAYAGIAAVRLERLRERVALRIARR
ncbi:MAG TPA: SRPBCC family protein [Jiangellaceae bacterium]